MKVVICWVVLNILEDQPVAYNEKVFMYFYAESRSIRWKLFIRYIKHGLSLEVVLKGVS